jgi:tetratricopeptide (TPR) repeat protein
MTGGVLHLEALSQGTDFNYRDSDLRLRQLIGRTQLMELRLLRPHDQKCPEFDTEQVGKLRDKAEFSDDLEWTIYQAKVFYEVFGDAGMASELLKKALLDAPQNADLLACLAECCSRSPDKLEEARHICSMALKINDGSDYAHTIMARVQLALGLPMDAYCSAMAALKLNSHNFVAGVLLGVIGFAVAMAEKNIEEMERSIENLRVTLSLNSGSQRLQRIITEKERQLAEIRKRMA